MVTSTGKVVLVQDTVKTYGRMEVYLHAFLTSALGGGDWSAVRPGSFTPWEPPSTPCIGRWVGTRAGLDAVAKKKIPTFCRESNPHRPALIFSKCERLCAPPNHVSNRLTAALLPGVKRPELLN